MTDGHLGHAEAFQVEILERTVGAPTGDPMSASFAAADADGAGVHGSIEVPALAVVLVQKCGCLKGLSQEGFGVSLLGG